MFIKARPPSSFDPHLNERCLIRKASILDVPYIYDLIWQGSKEGSFTDRYLNSDGYVILLIELLKILIRPLHADGVLMKLHVLQIVECNGMSIGLLHYTLYAEMLSGNYLHVEHFAVAPAHRNTGNGAWIVDWLIEEAVKNESTLTACCTKYALVMQRIFKKRNFIRTSIGYGLELYSLPYRPLDSMKNTRTAMQAGNPERLPD